MDEWIELIQRLYPKIYLACHVDHVRATSNPQRLSSKDSSVLAHLDADEGESPAALARHLRLKPSSLTPVVARLEKLRLIERRIDASDRRKHRLLLTSEGRKALGATSVLDRDRLLALARRMSRAERTRAAEGLALLAEAARRPDRKASSR